jgi:hypothetical protein
MAPAVAAHRAAVATHVVIRSGTGLPFGAGLESFRRERSRLAGQDLAFGVQLVGKAAACAEADLLDERDLWRESVEGRRLASRLL